MKKSFLASRQFTLLHRPLIVGTLTGSAGFSDQLKIARSSSIDILELRLDGFSKAYGAFQKAYDFGRTLIGEIKRKTKLPILLTFRAGDERGGATGGGATDDKRRSEILARLLPMVDLVDVEIRRVEFARRMTVIAHIHGVDVIHSAHDFKSAGKWRQLEKLAARSIQLKGDIFKAAVTPQVNDDVERFLNWGQGLKNPRKVLIAMGSVGLISRIAGFSFGSLMTYGHLGKSAAPGQLPARNLAASIRHVYSGN